MQNETGAKYAEPIDAIPCIYTYTETDEPIEAEGEILDKEINSEDEVTL